MQESGECHLILGRPFLATSKALINVHKGSLTLTVDGESASFSIDESRQYLPRFESCSMIDDIAPTSSNTSFPTSHVIPEPS